MPTFEITHPGGLTVPEITNDPDVILDAYQDGLTLERVPAPVAACGCRGCELAAQTEGRFEGAENALQSLTEAP